MQLFIKTQLTNNKEKIKNPTLMDPNVENNSLSSSNIIKINQHCRVSLKNTTVTDGNRNTRKNSGKTLKTFVIFITHAYAQI